VEHLCIRFSDPSCIGFDTMRKKTHRQTAAKTLVAAVDMHNQICISLCIASEYEVLCGDDYSEWNSVGYVKQLSLRLLLKVLRS